MDQKDNNNYLTDKEIRKLCFYIMGTMDGVPLGQAILILDETKRLLLDAHMVMTRSSRFKAKKQEFLESDLSDSGQA